MGSALVGGAGGRRVPLRAAGGGVAALAAGALGKPDSAAGHAAGRAGVPCEVLSVEVLAGRPAPLPGLAGTSSRDARSPQALSPRALSPRALSPGENAEPNAPPAAGTGTLLSPALLPDPLLAGWWSRTACWPAVAPSTSDAGRTSSRNSSSRLRATPAASTSSATALMPIATYTKRRRPVATPAIRTPIATTTSAALNRITLLLLVPGRARNRRKQELATVVDTSAIADAEAASVLDHVLRARRVLTGRRATRTQ